MTGAHSTDAFDPADADCRDFEKLCDRVVLGQHLPSVRDLIRGCPFLCDDIRADAKAFADEALDRLVGVGESGEGLMFALAELMGSPTTDDYLIAATEFERAAVAPGVQSTSPAANATRCHFYAAVAGHAASAHKVAGDAVSMAYSRWLPSPEVSRQCQAAVAWLLVTTNRLTLPSAWTRQAANGFVAMVDTSSGPGRKMVERMMQSRTNVLADEADDQRPGADAQPRMVELAVTAVTAIGGGPDEESATRPWVMVMTHIGDHKASNGKRVAAEFEPILGKLLPLTPVPDLRPIRAQIVAEFPHAALVIDTILQTLTGLRHVFLPPLILVGPPGCGKSSLAVRLAAVLDLPSEIFPCAAVADGALAGTARRWATGAAALPLSLIRRYEHAGPTVILDEIEKAVGSRTINGSMFDALLAFLEPGTARAWRDPYVEAPVDLSHVTWICTANSLEGLPPPLIDRCRIIQFPAPTRPHIAILANRILINTALENGMDPRWATPLDGTELAALSSAWPGGSLRHLAKLVGAVVRTREHLNVRH